MAGKSTDVEGQNPSTSKGSYCCCSCCGRFANEFSIKIFALFEEPYGELDMERNFQIGEGFLSIAGVSKIIFFGLSIATLVADIMNDSYPGFYMAYLSSWSLVYCILYLIGSLLLTVFPSCHDRDENNFLLKFTWMSFSLVAVHQLVVLLVYWITVYYPGDPATFATYMCHGGVAVLCIIDGLIINRTPVRISHMIVNIIMGVLYVTWSAIQNTVIRNNPYDDGDADDDALYGVTRWRSRPGITIGIALGLNFVVVPAFQVMFWALSLPGRRYLPSTVEPVTL